MTIVVSVTVSACLGFGRAARIHCRGGKGKEEETGLTVEECLSC